MLAIDPKLTIAGFREYLHFAAPEILELYVTGLAPGRPAGGVALRPSAAVSLGAGKERGRGWRQVRGRLSEG